MHCHHHGGLCCGIKTIHGLGAYPNNPLAALPEATSQFDGGHAAVGQRFFTDEAPAETYLERLDRYLAFIDGHRSHGIVEVILADNAGDSGYNQIPVWHDLLLERGFVEVNSCLNSNSSNNVVVYMRNT